MPHTLSRPTESEHDRALEGGRRTRDVFAGLKVERRALEGGGESRQLIGHASVFDQRTTLYEGRYYTIREVIRPGAFARALAARQDVRSLFNHDPNFVLGRTTSGTLTLSEDDAGLLAVIDLPDTQTVRDLVIAPIDREDVSGMSFAFSPRIASKIVRTELEDGTEIVDAGGLRVTSRREGERLVEDHEILDCDLYDVSPVTYPAYEGTDVALRSRDASFLARIDALDRPHRRRSPVRDSYRHWLDAEPKPPQKGTIAV